MAIGEMTKTVPCQIHPNFDNEKKKPQETESTIEEGVRKQILPELETKKGKKKKKIAVGKGTGRCLPGKFQGNPCLG